MKSVLVYLLHCACAHVSSPVAVDPAEADQAAAGAGAHRGPAPGDQVTNGSAAPGHVTTVLTSDWLSRGLAFSCHKSVFIWDFENIDTSTSAFCGTMTRI